MTLHEEISQKPLGFIVEKDREVKEENIQDFFRRLRKTKPIGKIYYPGPGIDDSLNGVFTPEEVTYLDRTPQFEGVMHGKFSETGFEDDSFDVVFLQDAHQKRADFKEMIRTLKPGGILVFSMYGCGMDSRDSMTIDDVRVNSQLQEILLVPERKEFFLTFTKK